MGATVAKMYRRPINLAEGVRRGSIGGREGSAVRLGLDHGSQVIPVNLSTGCDTSASIVVDVRTSLRRRSRRLNEALNNYHKSGSVHE